ncbi:Spaetzle [Halocaridina rubra]|uniref:Spaetzle n=1 Tax=Halocaridina rubra TaxID=373956 RepID=A0AAN8XIF9_HALRR
MAVKYWIVMLLVGVVVGDPEAKAEAKAESKAEAEAEPEAALVLKSYGYTQAYHPSTYGPTYPSVTPGYPAYPAVTPGYAVTPVYPAVTPAYPAVTPAYPVYPSPKYPSHPAPAYPSPHYPIVDDYKCHGYEKVPKCTYNTTKPWCLYDLEYPEYEIIEAIHYHKENVLSLYADVADLSTANSVYRPRYLKEETYLCPSDTSYVRPLRAVNTEGHWRIIVNNVKVDYEVFTQTTRIEECLSYGPCPLVPHCHESKCLQKFIYHRFLVYDPCDKYFPFSIETFRLPSTCACLLGAYFL